MGVSRKERGIEALRYGSGGVVLVVVLVGVGGGVAPALRRSI